MSIERERLERNLERYTASKSNMEKKKAKHPNDASVQDWTTREIDRLTEIIADTQAKLDALGA
jgi:hypothetical protein